MFVYSIFAVVIVPGYGVARVGACGLNGGTLGRIYMG